MPRSDGRRFENLQSSWVLLSRLEVANEPPRAGRVKGLRVKPPRSSRVWVGTGAVAHPPRPPRRVRHGLLPAPHAQRMVARVPLPALCRRRLHLDFPGPLVLLTGDRAKGPCATARKYRWLMIIIPSAILGSWLTRISSKSTDFMDYQKAGMTEPLRRPAGSPCSTRFIRLPDLWLVGSWG